MSVLEEILEEIEAYKKAAYENKNFGGLTAFKIVQDIIRKHMNDGWIPVEERLPENNKSVLAYAKSRARGGDVCFVGSHHGGVWFLQSDIGTESYPTQYDVVAWRPLPEPYHPERSDNHDGK